MASFTFHTIGAAYGAKEGSFDVTARVDEIINERESTVLAVNNDSFGDPAKGHGKHFGIVYVYNGTTMNRACGEGQTIDLSKAAE